MVARSEAGPSSATMSTLTSPSTLLHQTSAFAPSPSDAVDTPGAGIHVHPHGAHLHGAGTIGDEEDEHDYESLPVGAGLWVNMAAGAMVSASRHLGSNLRENEGHRRERRGLWARIGTERAAVDDLWTCDGVCVV
jgi:hypothetical protein